MPKILFTTDMYFPKANANGLCVDALAKEFILLNYEVHILCYRFPGEERLETIDNIIVHRVKPNFFYYFRRYYEEHFNTRLGRLSWKIGSFLHKFEKFIHIFHYPLESWISVNRYCRHAERIINDEDISAVISLYKPITSAISLQRVKKKHSNLFSVLYIVDSFCDGVDKTNTFLNKCNFRWENSLYAISDLIINMECHRKQLESEYYDPYRDKMTYSDIPVLKRLNIVGIDLVDLPFDNSTINIAYCGTVYNPRLFEYFLNKFNDIEVDGKKVVLHIWGRNPRQEILELEKIYEHLHYHGSVSDIERNAALMYADAIFSECPSGETMIPSKLFVSFATGNRIVHVTDNIQDDVCISYLKDYGNSLVLDTNSEYDFAKELDRLIHCNFLSFDEVLSLFSESSPIFTVNIIESNYKQYLG